MARYIGYPFANDPVSAGGSFDKKTTRARPSGPDVKDTLNAEPLSSPSGLLPQTNGNSVHTPSRSIMSPLFSAGNDLIFERIWVTPQLIEASFITESKDYEIAIWNAYQERSVVFSAIDSTSPTGTTLTTPTLPVNITQSDDLVLTLTIDQEGPPLQNTTYTTTIDGIDFVITITGIRVIGLVPEPNWGPGIQINYSFETAMFQTPRFREQRRPLMDTPYRQAYLRYLSYDTEAHRFFYVLAYGHDKIFGVPIYNEMMRASDIPNGGTVITTTTATTDMYNLNNLCSHIAIVDHNNNLSEIKEFSSIGTNSITVSQAITGTYNVNTTLIYPVFFASVTSLQKSHATDDVETIEIEFGEFNDG